MATGDDLLRALSASRYNAAEDPFGVAAQTIGGSLPGLVNPYSSPGSQMAHSVGGGLLAALLGSYARSRTDEQNVELGALQSQFLSADENQRAAMLASEPRLAPLQQYLVAQQIDQRNRVQGAQAEYEALRGLKREDANLERLDAAAIDLNKDLGKTLNPETGEVVQVYDPIQIEVDKQRQVKTAGLQAEADFIGYNPQKEAAADTLRKEFSSLPEVKNYGQVEKAAGIISKALQDDSAVSDQELVRYGILLIEPGLAVREGEAAAIANSQSLPDALKGQYGAALNGTSKLGPDAREGLKRLAMRAFEGHKAQYDRALGFYQGEAKAKGIEPGRVSYMGPSMETQQVMGDAAPPGFKIQRNRVTGETRVVPQ